MTEHLDFEKSGLNTYLVGNKKNEYLGQIVWNPRWREFVFETADETHFSAGCLGEIVEFMEPLNRERKESIKRLKQIERERKQGGQSDG